MPKVAAIFDLDGTLTDGHIWKGLSNYCRTFKVNRWRSYLFFVTHFGFWLLFRLRILPQNSFYSLWLSGTATLLKGITKPKGIEVFYWIASREIMAKTKPEIIEELVSHQKRGHEIIIVSSAFNGLLRQVGKRLDVAHTVGTDLEVKESRYTGKILGRACFGQEKATLLQRYLKLQLNHPVDLSQSYAYGNDLQDVAILELVGNAVVVQPNRKLSKIANQRNWKILGAGKGRANRDRH